MPKVAWIDIVSPKLRQAFALWAHFRGNRLLPTVQQINDFSVNADGIIAPEYRLLSLLQPSENGLLFKHVGIALAPILPNLKNGTLLKRTSVLGESAPIIGVFLQAFRSRQADCRRLSGFDLTDSFKPEQLVLPFGDPQGRVVAINVLYDFGVKV